MDNEYDHIPGDISEWNIDWGTVDFGLPPSTSGTTDVSDIHQPASPNASSSYGYSDDEMDDTFLAEAYRVEQDALALLNNSGSSTSSTNVIQTTTTLAQASTSGPANDSSRYFQTDHTSAVAQARKRSASSEEPHIEQASAKISKKLCLDDASLSPKRKGKMKAEGALEYILSANEDEISCPICCDIMASAHVGVPCGHAFCGDCGWQWYMHDKSASTSDVTARENEKALQPSCPCCRESLDEYKPMIPNIALDNIIENHLKALARTGKAEWDTDGRLYCDWLKRKRAWNNGAAQRVEYMRQREKEKKRKKEEEKRRKKEEKRRQRATNRPASPTRRPPAAFAVEVYHPPAHWQAR